MALYKVEITKKVRRKDLPSIPPKDVSRIANRIKKLSENPYPDDAIRLKGRLEYRIRQGDYRILYIVEDDILTVFVIKVGHRKNVYKT